MNINNTDKRFSKENLLKMSGVAIYQLILDGDIKKFPDGYWMKDNALDEARLCIRYHFENILKYSEEDIITKSTIADFRNSKLRGMSRALFNEQLFQIINCAYKDEIKEWQLTSVPRNYWKDEQHIILATKWLIIDVLHYDKEDILNKLTFNDFAEHKLDSMLRSPILNGSYINAVLLAFPDIAHPWEFKNKPKNFWDNEDNISRALKWLIEEKYQFSDEDFLDNYCATFIQENKLEGLLHSKLAQHSPFKAYTITYGEDAKFNEWEFKNTPNGFWNNDDNIKRAVKWLFFTKLNIDESDIPNHLTAKVFKNNGLGGLLASKKINGNPRAAIDITFPNLI